MKRVVITGMGAVTPLGRDVEATWAAAREGRSGTRALTRFDARAYKTRVAAEVVDWSACSVIPAREARKMDRFVHFGLEASLEALAQAGLVARGSLKVDAALACDVGVSMGSAVGGLATIETASRTVAERGPGALTPFQLPMALVNMLAGNASLFIGARGPCLSFATACASSAHAIGEAARAIQRGEARIMVAGGAEAAITPLCIGGFAAMRALSQWNDAPERASRPLDVRRDGFVVGEGGAVLVLEDEESARARGATILAELAGYAATADAHHITAPSVDGPAAAMTRALADARLGPGDVDFVSAHATGTPVGDLNEVRALRSVLGAGAAARVRVGCTKSMTGHMLGAAGAMSAIFAMKAMADGVVPPTINADEVEPECEFDVTPHRAARHAVSVALCNSFGFGGMNAALVLRAPRAMD
jgi:3-oxoacyl-[acyl-carrier-protein] synthase II